MPRTADAGSWSCGVSCATRQAGTASGGALFELTELDVTAGADVAFARGLLRCGMPEEFVANPDNRLRLTMGLRKVDGRWLIAHEHHSFPMTD